MNSFSAVDRSPDPQRLVRFLDLTAVAETGMKHYMAATHAARRPARPILDLGCGAGHDLMLLASFGLTVVGVEPSASMLRAAQTKEGDVALGIVQGAGEALPFPDRVFSGCRIERVLMHVENPRHVIEEALRCIEPGGLLTAFEPDWNRFKIKSDVLPANATWITGVPHPEAGAELWGMLESAGCRVLDRVEELSIWRSIAILERVTGFPRSVERAVALGRLDEDDAILWIDEQRQRHAEGRFEAQIPKVLVVAQKLPG